MNTLRLGHNLRLSPNDLTFLKNEYDAELRKVNGWWTLTVPPEELPYAISAINARITHNVKHA